MLQDSMSPTINTPNRVTKNTAKAINHIITNSTFDNNFKSSMVKNDIFDHFCNFFNHIFNYIKRNWHRKRSKRTFYLWKNLKWKVKLGETFWNTVKLFKNHSKASNYFINIFSSLYDESLNQNKLSLNVKKKLSTLSFTSLIKKMTFLWFCPN